jgi:LmbE family N-acetylglucosaminyl deacetylase
VNNTFLAKTLVLSPHFDDACYSVGGLLSKKTMFDEIVILTIFSKSVFAPNVKVARVLLRNSIAQYVTEKRKKEDSKFCDSIGAAQRFLPFKEATLRGYPSLSSIFQVEDVESEPIYRNVCESLEDSISSGFYNAILCPLGVGNHVDHLIVITALSRILTNGKSTNSKIYFYEDLPYAATYESEYISWLAWERARTRKPLLVDITSEISVKKESIRIYRSQFDKKTEKKIEFHAKRLCISRKERAGNCAYCERLWKSGLP